MQLLKVYLWIVQISFASFGGAYSVWALVMDQAGHDCTAHSGYAAQPTNPVNACRSDLQRLMSIAELLPGPQVNAIAMSAYAEYGIPGMFVMVLGLITPGLVLVPAVLWLLRRHFPLSLLKAFFAGAGIATTAVLVHFAIALIRPLLTSQGGRNVLLLSCAVMALTLSMRYKVNPAVIVILGGIFGYYFL
ncbi:MAG: chromate transporter [Spirochaetota bacterium]